MQRNQALTLKFYSYCKTCYESLISNPDMITILFRKAFVERGMELTQMMYFVIHNSPPLIDEPELSQLAAEILTTNIEGIGNWK